MQLGSNRIPPTGVVAMLFTDIEGSTAMAQKLEAEWPAVLTEHRRIVRGAIHEAGGYIEGTEGDSFFAAFSHAEAAVSAAINAQRALRGNPWPDHVGEVRVRMGVHTGPVEHTDGHYVGIEVHRAARVGAAASGGQVLLTDAARAQLRYPPVVEELGWHRLKDFPDPIRLFHIVVDADRTAAAFPPPRTLDVRPTNLPPRDRPLVGRADEQHTIVSALLNDDARLVTLTGLGGVGKTSVALEVGRSLLDAFKDGVWLIRAESLRSRLEVLQAVAAALRIRDVPGADPIVAVAERLETGRYLLVLDNLEHLADAAPLVAELLKCSPGVAILATSRVPLHLESERAITIGAMPPPEAVDLFMARALLADPTLSVDDPATRDAVTALCVRLGCLPLALELAAARLKLMTPAQLADRLGSALELKSAESDRPERQRSVRATIEWTLGLLPEDASTLFTRLGVFAGTPSLDVIEQVCGDGLDVLEAAATLVDYSLLQKRGLGLALVEALREVASERLEAAPEREGLRRAHAEAMVVLGRTVRSPTTAKPAELGAMERLTPDTWAAARWARVSDPRLHGALVANLSSWWAWMGSLRLAMDEVEAAVAYADLRPAERGELMLSHAHLLLLAGRPAEAQPIVEEAIALTPERSDMDRGDDLGLLALTQLMTGKAGDAVASGRASLEHYRRTGDRERTVLSLAQLAQFLLAAGDPAGAGPMLDEAERLGAGLATLSALGLPNIRADWSLATGDPARALAGYLESLTSSMAGGTQLASYDIAGVVVALAKLERYELALEFGAMVAESAAEWGTTLETFSWLEGGVPGAIAAARAALGPERAATADARGREIVAKDRSARALDVGRAVLAERGVREHF